MEAPEKVWIYEEPCSMPGVQGRRDWEDRKIDYNEHYALIGEYTRSDLCTPPTCKHGTRWPHECRDCFDEAFPGKASTIPGELAELSPLFDSGEANNLYERIAAHASLSQDENTRILLNKIRVLLELA